ncbi:MAG: hypothetical protein NZ555_11180 [Geminicoccaceae bacterium]|nr:hypothetical protein [Geminicoccaceae bacterium]MCX8099707.1 hypothetical protein [Geminicoccaceae bacterium]MDW8370860.1 hypothetical protein [Geminicoccaceae bacterium]
MRHWSSPVRARRAVPVAAALAALTGCVDPIVNRPSEPDVERWRGRAEPIAEREAACGAVEFRLFREGLSLGGRAIEPDGGAVGIVGATRQWFVEGTVNPNGSFLFELRQSGTLPSAQPRPLSVWRGSFGAGDPVAVEQPPGCGRRVRLVRETEPAAAS